MAPLAMVNEPDWTRPLGAVPALTERPSADGWSLLKLWLLASSARGMTVSSHV